MKYKVFVSILLIVCVIGNFSVFATTISDYKNQQQQTEEEKNNIKNTLSQVTTEKASTQEEVSSLNNSIIKVQSEMSDLEDKIDVLDTSINNQQKELDEKQKMLEERLVVSYMNGEPTYLDALLSGGISNFISNYETIKQIVEYDNNLIVQVKNEKEELEQSKASLENSKKEVDEKKSELQNKKSEREEKVKSLTEDEKKAQADLEQKENELNQINEAVKAEQKRIDDEKAKEEEARKKAEIAASKNKDNEANSKNSKSTNNSENTGNTKNSNNNSNNVSNITSGEMCWPTRIAHKVNSIYAPGGRSDTSGYYGTAHKGVDINAPSGTPIYAAEEGTVVYVNYSGYGGGWGLYVIVYHGKDSNGNAVYTRYAHASSIASGISVGTKVTPNTLIMYAGATGSAEGAHLHFEVCLNSMYNQVNPCPYLGIPNARGTY